MTLRFDDERILSVFNAILESESAKRYDKTEGWLHRYNGELADREAGVRYLRSIRNTVRLKDGDIAGKKILDIGCGFGMTMLSLALMGADSVYGIDMFKKMIDTIDAYLPDIHLDDKIHATVGRADAMPYDGNKFDMALTIEALSHFLKPDDCLLEAHRVLKPGGIYVITDDNNGANRSIIEENQEIWDRFENGPSTDDIHGHRILISYRDKRKKIIEQQYPELSEKDISLLAENTAFMAKPEIVEACKKYIETSVVPNSPYKKRRCPVEPEEGQYIENLINPLELKHKLEKIGFHVRLEAYFGGASRGGLLKAANFIVNKIVPKSLLFRISPGFRIWSTKK